MNRSKEQMRRDWDERARRNAFLYIASWRKDWDETSFFESGEQDYLRLVQPILQKFGLAPEGKAMAELGCGAGRMTRSFAQRFHSVFAVDISAEMQSRGKAYLQEFSNIRWLLSDGEKLSGMESNAVDFVFSYLVLQHMPSKEVVFDAIQEMMRILSPDGAFLFQFNGSDEPSMNWKGRMVSRALDAMFSMGLKRPSQRIASLAGIDPGMVGRTWRGAMLSAREIEEAVRLGKGSPEGFIGPNTPLAWCYGRKQTGAQA